MTVTAPPRDRRILRTLAVAAVIVVWLLATLPPQAGLAAAPNIREITPAGITIDGSPADWDTPDLDFLTDMFEAGNPTKDVLARAYGRYDCATQTFYIFVVSIRGWVILPSNSDNYVKLGQTDKLVDGNSGNNGTPPDFAYVDIEGWEASFHIAPGSYLGEGALNIHAEMVPLTMSATAAPVNRRMDAIIDCSNPETPPPTPSPTPTPPTPTPTRPGSDPHADTYADGDAFRVSIADPDTHAHADAHAHAHAHADADAHAHAHAHTHADPPPRPRSRRRRRSRPRRRRRSRPVRRP